MKPGKATFTDGELLDFENQEQVVNELTHTLVTIVGRDPAYATSRDWYSAVSYLLRGVLAQRMTTAGKHVHQYGQRRIYYLSLEWLPGRCLRKTVSDLGIDQALRRALASMGVDFDEIAGFEPDPALGNGGLGRLAACFLDSMATHRYPGFGYGIRYEFGLFTQTIEQGMQVEHPEPWLRYGDPWQFKRPDIHCPIRFGGRMEKFTDHQGNEHQRWVEAETVWALAYDLPMSGYESDTVLYLRLWSARSSREFDLSYFNEGNYIDAVHDKTLSEVLSKVLYPNDSTTMGQILRLKQEYFFVSASLQDILRRHLKSNRSLENFSQTVAIQLNDTHPSLAIPELMRLLIDEHGFSWEKAWGVTSETFGYTCHTLLPEALETWPIHMLEQVLPRHLDIIYQINHAHLQKVKDFYPGEPGKLGTMSLVDDAWRRIRMAHLAVVGSRKVNGVSELHSHLLRDHLFPDFARMDSKKFIGITNGITQRRWLLMSNSGLADLISKHIGPDWIKDLSKISKLEALADDSSFQATFAAIKRENKDRLALFVEDETGVKIDPATLFDVQVKRIHEYKRQLLNVLHVVTRYNRIKAGRSNMPPRTVIIAGKAAPGYQMAKLIIHLINDIAAVIDKDPEVRDLLKLIFIPDYKITSAELIIPGADISQHISTAGTEASGTGNMKFALNGGIILGTRDGANIEIEQAVGQDNIFMFGLNADHVHELRSSGYSPTRYYNSDEELQQALDMIAHGYFNPEDQGRYQSIKDALLSGGDHYLLLADYQAYIKAQDRIDEAYHNPEAWIRKAILNTARMGNFSADRAIHDYAEKVWDLKPLPVGCPA